MFEQAAEFGGDVLAYVGQRLCHLVDQLRAPVDEGDDVAEVAAAEEVAVSAALERLELGGEQVGWRDSVDGRSGRQLACDGGWAQEVLHQSLLVSGWHGQRYWAHAPPR
jgi:hypothetical protein